MQPTASHIARVIYERICLSSDECWLLSNTTSIVSTASSNAFLWGLVSLSPSPLPWIEISSYRQRRVLLHILFQSAQEVTVFIECKDARNITVIEKDTNYRCYLKIQLPSIEHCLESKFAAESDDSFKGVMRSPVYADELAMTAQHKQFEISQIMLTNDLNKLYEYFTK